MPPTIVRHRPAELTTFRRPQLDPKSCVAFDGPDSPRSVIVRRSVIDTIVAASHEAAPDETTGFLAGRIFRDDQGVWTLVEQAFVCDNAKRSRVSVRTSDEDSLAHAVWLADEALGLDSLGWFHSHYELGVLHYSSVDRSNQERWCEREGQVGLLVVVEGGQPRVRCYRGPKSEALKPFLRVTELRAADGLFAQELPSEVHLQHLPLPYPKRLATATARLLMQGYRVTRFAACRSAYAIAVGLLAALFALRHGKSPVSTQPPQSVTQP